MTLNPLNESSPVPTNNDSSVKPATKPNGSERASKGRVKGENIPGNISPNSNPQSNLQLTGKAGQTSAPKKPLPVLITKENPQSQPKRIRALPTPPPTTPQTQTQKKSIVSSGSIDSQGDTKAASAAKSAGITDPDLELFLGNRRITDTHVVEAAKQVLHGKAQPGDIELLKKHNIVPMERESAKLIRLKKDGEKITTTKKTYLVFNKIEIGKGSFGKIIGTYGKKGELVEKVGNSRDKLKNNEEIEKEVKNLNQIRRAAGPRKHEISDHLILGKATKSIPINSEEAPSSNEVPIVGIVMSKGDKPLDLALKGADAGTKARYLKELLENGIFLKQLGFIHRDLKPQNIVLHEGHLKLIDFGATIQQNQVTKNLQIEGSPGYFAPENLGKTYAVTTASDAFSYGVVILKEFLGVDIFDGVPAPKVGDDPYKDPRNLSEKIYKLRTTLEGLNKNTPNPLYHVVIGLLHGKLVNPEKPVDPEKPKIVERPEDRMTLEEAMKILNNKDIDIASLLQEHQNNYDSKLNPIANSTTSTSTPTTRSSDTVQPSFEAPIRPLPSPLHINTPSPPSSLPASKEVAGSTGGGTQSKDQSLPGQTADSPQSDAIKKPIPPDRPGAPLTGAKKRTSQSKEKTTPPVPPPRNLLPDNPPMKAPPLPRLPPRPPPPQNQPSPPIAPRPPTPPRPSPRADGRSEPPKVPPRN